MNLKALLVPLGVVVVIVVPFALRPRAAAPPADAWRLVVISPHHQGIQYEFGIGFAEWHRQTHGRAVEIDWRNIGGTSEIARYVDAQMLASFKTWWTDTRGKPWSEAIANAAQNRKLDQGKASAEEWAARQAYLDEATPLDCGIDVFFGGGQYDLSKQAKIGNTARLHIPEEHPELIANIPPGVSGERFYEVVKPGRPTGPGHAADRYYGACLTTFGLCYNFDRLAELGLEPPRQWSDLADPRYVGQIGLADPTKSGSITKAFEMLIQQQIWITLSRQGVTMANYDEALSQRPDEVAAAVAAGWVEALRVIQLCGANTRYFTDSSSKVPIDVGQGDAAAGMCIDFYGRYQSEFARRPDGSSRMAFIVPIHRATGIYGSSVSADPIAMFRMPLQRDDAGRPVIGQEGYPRATGSRPYRHVLAKRFVHFVLSDAGQKLWCYRAGTPGGPVKYTLRRLPMPTDFYNEANRRYMADPDVEPYEIAEAFSYNYKWTAHLFGPIRVLIRCMCIDPADELKAAWRAILDAGGPDACPQAVAALTALPSFQMEVKGKTLRIGADYGEGMSHFGAALGADAATQVKVTERMMLAFRENYAEARRLAGSRDPQSAVRNVLGPVLHRGPQSPGGGRP